MNTFQLCKEVILNRNSKLFHISEALEVLKLIKHDLDFEHEKLAEILEYIASKRLEDQPYDVILQDVVTVNQDLISDIEQINTIENDQLDIKITQLKTIKANLKLKKLLKDLISNLTNVELEEHTSTTELLNSVRKLVSDAFEELATLDTVSDESEFIIDIDVDMESQFKDKQHEFNISTGFDSFDEMILGFRSSRIYIFLGGTGKGKSLLLNNMAYNLALNFKTSEYKETFDKECPDRKPMILFITNENTIEETLKRLVAIIRDETPNDTTYTKDYIVETLRQFSKETGVSIVVKYVPPRTATAFDIYSMALNYERKFGYKTYAIIVDYLDRLLPLKPSKEERLSLGYITDELKAVAIKMNVPLLTASQLNREGYKSDNPDLTNIGESWKKVENADVVITFNATENQSTQETIYDLTAQKVRYYRPASEPIQLCRNSHTLRVREQCANQRALEQPQNSMFQASLPVENLTQLPF